MARTSTIFLWAGDYADRLDMLRNAAMKAKQDTSELLNGEEHPYDVLSREYEELKAEADAAGLRVTIRGLSDDEWFALTDAHPPRTEEPHAENDKALGFNERTGLRALVHAALIEPDLPTRSRFDDWVAEAGLTRGDLTRLGMDAWRLTNGSAATDPKSLPSLPTRDVDED